MNLKILGLASAAVLAFTAPAFAQLKPAEPPAKAAGKIDVPPGVVYAGLGPTQYLAKARLIGQSVVDKAGAKLAVVEDVILGTADNKIDGLLLDANGKKVGVRLAAFKIETKDGKTTVALPQITAEMIKVLPAYGAKK